MEKQILLTGYAIDISIKNAIEVLIVKSYGTMLNSDNFLHCFISKLRKSLSKRKLSRSFYLTEKLKLCTSTVLLSFFWLNTYFCLNKDKYFQKSPRVLQYTD